MANHYIRAGASGAGDGSDWTNAWTNLPISLTRGDTYYFADGDYGSQILDDNESGTDYIYLKKAIESDHGTDTGWVLSYGDGQATFNGGIDISSSYWEIDGQTRNSDWISGYGFYIDCSSAKGIQNTVGDEGYVTVKYVEIEGSYVAGADDGFYLVNPRPPGPFTVQYCYIHDIGRVPLYCAGLSNGLTLEYCYIARNISTDALHAEGMFFLDGNDFVCRYNYWVDIQGTGIIMIGSWGGSGTNGADIYGNVFWDTGSGGYSHGTVATTDGADSVNNVRIHHNTMVDCVGNNAGFDLDFGGTMTNCSAYNNLFYNNDVVRIDVNTHEYNAYDDGNARGEANAQTNIDSSYFTNYAGDDFTLAKATNAGYNLGNPYNYDLLSNLRGNDGVIDRGAFEYVSEGIAVPKFSSITATGAANNRQVDFKDTLTIAFDINTNQPAANTKANLDSLFTFSQALGDDYTGAWTDEKTLVITIVDPRNNGNPQTGSFTVTAKTGNGIKNEAETSAEMNDVSPVLSGGWRGLVAAGFAML